VSPQIGLNGRWGRRCWDCSEHESSSVVFSRLSYLLYNIFVLITKTGPLTHHRPVSVARRHINSSARSGLRRQGRHPHRALDGPPVDGAPVGDARSDGRAGGRSLHRRPFPPHSDAAARTTGPRRRLWVAAGEGASRRRGAREGHGGLPTAPVRGLDRLGRRPPCGSPAHVAEGNGLAAHGW